MTLNEYMQKALRTAQAVRGSLAYSMGGVGGEAGEYVDVVKKYLFHNRPFIESQDKARSELGDLLWGIAQAADAWGLTLEDIAAANVEKLLKRYPEGYSHEAAQKRADTIPVDANGTPVGEP